MTGEPQNIKPASDADADSPAKLAAQAGLPADSNKVALSGTATGSKFETPLAAEDQIQFSRQQPPWHVFVLSAFTLTVYNIYWFYKCVNQLHDTAKVEAAVADKDQAGKIEPTGASISSSAAQGKDNPIHFVQDHPFFSTFLFLIPVANLIIGMQFFALVGELMPDKNNFWHKNTMLCGFGLALAFGALLLFSLLPEPYHLLYLLSALPLALVQLGLNQHWKVVENDRLLVRTAFNPLELVVIFFGAGFLGLCLIGPSIIPHAGH